MNSLAKYTLDELIAARASAIRWANATSVEALTVEIDRRITC